MAKKATRKPPKKAATNDSGIDEAAMMSKLDAIWAELQQLKSDVDDINEKLDDIAFKLQQPSDV